MGIYDRDYYRDERSGLASLIPEGGICKFLIIAQIAAFALQALDRNGVSESLGLQLAGLMSGEVWRILTFPFVQQSLSIMTLAFSLLFLWWFGSDLEQMYGSTEFLCFYLLSALIGGAAFLGVAYLRNVPGELLFGAFGPITAVTVLYAWHFPNHTIRLFFFLPVPMWLLVIIEMLGALMLAREQAAYILAAGAFSSLYYKKQWRFSGLFQGFGTWNSRPKARAKLRVFHPEVDEDFGEPVGVSAPKSAPLLDEHLEAKVDAVLEKMARSGKESLSDKERDILLQASEIYRRKRT